MAVGEESGYPTSHPKGYLEVGKERGRGLPGKQRVLAIQFVGGRCKWYLQPLFVSRVKNNSLCNTNHLRVIKGTVN